MADIPPIPLSQPIEAVGNSERSSESGFQQFVHGMGALRLQPYLEPESPEVIGAMSSLGLHDTTEILRNKITSDGDLWLRIGTEFEEGDDAVEYLVDSKILISSCAFFKRMLDGPWKDSLPKNGTQDGVLVRELPEDDPSGWYIILSIMHGHYRNVPHDIDMHALFSVCVLVDEYKLAYLIRFFARRWGERAKHGDAVQGMWISWVLGNKAGFESACGQALMLSVPEMNLEGEEILVLDPRTREDSKYLDMIEITDHIAEKRREILGMLFAGIEKVYAELPTHSKEAGFLMSDKFRSALLCRGLQELLGLDPGAGDARPVPRAGQWEESIISVIQKINDAFSYAEADLHFGGISKAWASAQKLISPRKFEQGLYERRLALSRKP